MAIWPTFEVAKRIVGVLAPLSVAFLGWLFSRCPHRLPRQAERRATGVERRNPPPPAARHERVTGAGF